MMGDTRMHAAKIEAQRENVATVLITSRTGGDRYLYRYKGDKRERGARGTKTNRDMAVSRSPLLCQQRQVLAFSLTS